MSFVKSIPCPPGEDYDHPHSLSATLASLESLLFSFDAVFDSLETSTTQLNNRLDILSARCEGVRNTLDKAEFETTYSPASLPQITKEPNCVVREARERSNAVIEERLLRDQKESDFSGAKLSDRWLDRADGFDTEHMCREAMALHTKLPPLISKNYEMDTAQGKKGQRQQVISKSYPFLCTVLHDTYGCGVPSSSPDGLVSSPRTLGELRSLVLHDGGKEGNRDGEKAHPHLESENVHRESSVSSILSQTDSDMNL